MKITKFELRCRTSETRIARSIGIIQPGCTADFADVNQDSELIAAFENLETAKAALSEYETYVNFFTSSRMQCVSVTEYWVEENIYNVDDDGDADWVGGGDIWEYSNMPEELEWNCDTYLWNSVAKQYVLSGENNDDDVLN